MPRPVPTIHLDVSFSAPDADEADMRQWVRATEILLRIKARRDARLAAASVVRRTVLTISFTFNPLDVPRSLAAAI